MATDECKDGNGRRPPRPRHDGFDEERKRLFLVSLRRGDSVLAASALVGISTRTAYRHRERDPEFARAWELARRMHNMPLELAAFERGVTGIEEPVYRYGKLSHTRRRLSDSALMKLLAAEEPDKYGRAAGLGPLVEKLERIIDQRVAARSEALRQEIIYFVTQVFDRLLTVLLPPAERRDDESGVARRTEGPEISPNSLQP
jgi:hypothetical protein